MNFFTRIFILIGILGLFQSVSAQNNPCVNPKVVNSFPYNAAGSTCGNIKITNTCGYPNKNGLGEIYQLNIPANVSCIKVNLTNLTDNLGDRHFVYLMDDCPLSNPNAKCLYNNSFLGGTGTGNSITQNLDLNPGQTYYYVITSYIFNRYREGQPPLLYDCGNFKISIEADNDCPVYEDNCAMEEIQSLPFQSTQNTCQGKSMLSLLEDRLCIPSFFVDGHEFVYHYRNDNEDICADFKINKLGSEPVSATLSNFCRNYATTPNERCLAEFADSASYILEKGVDYFVYVHHPVATQDCATFSLSVEGKPLDDVTCLSAIDVADITNYVDSNDFACQKYPNPLMVSCNVEQYRNYYTFTVSEKSCVRIGYKRLAGDFFDKNSIQLFDACPESPGNNCVDGQVYDFKSNIFEDEKLYKYILEPATYYMIVSDSKQSNRYRIRIESTPHESIADLGTCAKPYENGSANYQEQILFDPCATMALALSYQNEAKIANSSGTDPGFRGASKVVKYTASEAGCYRFTARDTMQMQAMLLTDGCPNSAGANILAAAQAYLNYRHNFSVDLSDSLSFTVRLEAGQEVFWTLVGKMTPDETYGIDVEVVSLTGDACFDCEEDICKACGGISTENGKITGWKRYLGSFDNPAETEITTEENFVTVNNIVSGRHVVMAGGSMDPNAPIPVNNPFTGRYSIRLGNDQTNAEAEQMSFTYTIDDNSTFFTYYYAVVFEDPGHNPAEQPYFRVRVLTEDGSEIGCGVYEVSAGGGIPGFKQANHNNYNPFESPLYKEWEAVSIPVSAYQGQDLTVEFTTRDCSLGDHFGYAYFDATCETLGNLDDEIILCEGDSVALVAPPGFEDYEWDNGKTGQIVYTTVPGNFRVDMTTRTGCEYAQDAIVVQQDNPVISGFSYSQNCDESFISISANNQNLLPEAEDSFYWLVNGEDTVHSDLNWTLQKEPGRYLLSMHYDVPNACNFVIADSVEIYPQLSTQTQVPDTFVCSFDSVEVSVPFQPLVKYTWSNGDTLNSTYFDQGGDQYLLRNAGGCADSIPFNIDARVKYPFTLANDTSICWYDSLVVGTSMQPNTIYQWSNGETTPNITARDSGIYSLLTETNGCFHEDSIQIDFHRQAFVQLPQDTQLCFGDEYTVGYADTKNHLWNTGETTDSIMINTEGWYTLELRDAFCSEKDSIFVDTLTPPQFNLGPDTNYCENGSIILGPSHLNPSQHSFSWNTGQNQPQIAVGDTGLYALNVDDGICNSNDTVWVDMAIMPVYTLASDTFYCEDNTVVLSTAFDQGTRLWNTGETTQNIQVSTQGKYWVDVRNGSCFRTDTVNITERPFSFFIGNDTIVCPGNPVEIGTNMPGASYYSWNTGEDSAFIIVDEPNEYILEIGDGTCVNRDTLEYLHYDSVQVLEHNLPAELCIDVISRLHLECLNCQFMPQGATVIKRPVQIGSEIIYQAITINQCEKRDSLVISRQERCQYELFVPNAFTPGGDGFNEVFKPIMSTDALLKYEFWIFNRWGEQVFHTFDFREGWDGTMDGRKVMQEVYTWRVKLTFRHSTDVLEKRGTVALIR